MLDRFTPHFSRRELIPNESELLDLEAGLDEREVERRLTAVALVLEVIRAHVGPIRVMSALRSIHHNAALAGDPQRVAALLTKYGQHPRAQAVDTYPLACTPEQMWVVVVKLVTDALLSIDQAILEYTGDHVRDIHISVVLDRDPRRQLLVERDGVTKPWTSGAEAAMGAQT